MTTHKTKVVHTTDRFMKVLFTVIALSLVWLSVKDTRLEPGVTLDAQAGRYTHALAPNEIELRHSGSIQN